jgi:hypothetical protein
VSSFFVTGTAASPPARCQRNTHVAAAGHPFERDFNRRHFARLAERDAS